MPPLPWYRDPLVVGTLFIPVLWFLITLFVRNAMKGAQTSGADLISVLIGFDVGVILDPALFSHLAAPERTKNIPVQAITTANVTFLFLCLGCWLVAMIVVEPRLVRNVSRRAGWFASHAAPYLWGAVSWGACWALLYGHIWNLRGKFF